jgi:hypothetical protein
MNPHCGLSQHHKCLIVARKRKSKAKLQQHSQENKKASVVSYKISVKFRQYKQALKLESCLHHQMIPNFDIKNSLKTEQTIPKETDKQNFPEK